MTPRAERQAWRLLGIVIWSATAFAVAALVLAAVLPGFW
jgi:hypothetical protein